MVHVSDMSWTRKINHPSEMVKKGDEVDAIVVRLMLKSTHIMWNEANYPRSLKDI